MNGLEQVVLNRVQCKNCAEILTSYNRHDYKTCGCENKTMVDGGTAYQRYGGKDLDLVDTSLTIYLSEDHLVNRDAAHWGNRGKDGKSSLSYKSVAEMSNDHLTNIIKDMSGRMESWFEQIIVKELEHRDINNIIVPD
jgi:hypothetical protein